MEIQISVSGNVLILFRFFKYFEFLFLSESIIFFCRSSKGSSSHCSSADTGSDSCSANVRDTYFYVRVLAYSRLSHAKLEITGGNIASVEEVDAVDEITISPTTISPSTLTSVSKFSILIFVKYKCKFHDLVPFLDQIYPRQGRKWRMGKVGNCPSSFLPQ